MTPVLTRFLTALALVLGLWLAPLAAMAQNLTAEDYETWSRTALT